MSDLARHLQAVQGYIELRMLVEAANEVESIAPENRIHPSVVPYRYAIYAAMEKWDLAAATAGLMAIIYPGDPEWWIKWAYSTRRCRSVADARQILLEAEKLHPKEATIQFNLGCYACQLGELEEAKRRVALAISIDGKFRAMALDDKDLEPLWDDLLVLLEDDPEKPEG